MKQHLLQSMTSQARDVAIDSNKCCSELSAVCCSNGNDSDPDDDELCVHTLLLWMSQNEEDIFLAEKGYKKMNKICDTLQGELFKAEIIKSNGLHVAIKSIDKKLCKEQVAIQDGMSFFVEENIIKEAIILRHLTVDNTPIGNYIINFIDFFESATHFYLVTEYIDGMNLKQFIKKAHQYIDDGVLTLKNYRKTIKFIMWQLAVTIRGLHDKYHCCHLDICLENIMVQNAGFIEDENGLLKINNKLAIKLVDFGVAELFRGMNNNVSFECNKHGLTLDNEAYIAPQIYNEEMYDARKADMWALGMVFYECMVGKPLYKPRDLWQEYVIDRNHKLKKYLMDISLSTAFFNGASMSLLRNLLKIDENKRLNAWQVIQHRYFKMYYKRYKKRLSQTIITDKTLLKRQSSKMNEFPFYYNLRI